MVFSALRALCAVAVLTWLLGGPALAGEVPDSVRSAPVFVWVGIDYQFVEMHVPERFDWKYGDTYTRYQNTPIYRYGKLVGYAQTPYTVTRNQSGDDYLEALPAAWNQLWLDEMSDRLESWVRRPIEVSLNADEWPSLEQLRSRLRSDRGSKDSRAVTDAMLDEAVKGYRNRATNGIGMAFVADRFLKKKREGCFHIVFFDLGSRDLLAAGWACTRAGGSGFRNYWFRPLKNLGGSIRNWTSTWQPRGARPTIVYKDPEPERPVFGVSRKWTVLDLDELPTVQSTVAPVYPPGTEAEDVHGSVRLLLVVGPDGWGRDATVDNASDPRFVDAAIAVALRTVFDIPTVQGEPVEVTKVPFTVRFSLDEPEAP